MNTLRLLLWSYKDAALLVSREGALRCPAIRLPPRARLPVLAQEWCRLHRIHGNYLATVGGIGNVDGSVDWGAWLSVDNHASIHRAVSLDEITSNAADANDRRLASALTSILERASNSRWIAFHPDWPERVHSWISNSTRGTFVSPGYVLRSDASGLVARYGIDGRVAFFTTRPGRFDDVTICDALGAHAPGAVPSTLAYDADAGWWLTDSVSRPDAGQFIRNRADRQQAVADVLGAIAGAQVSTVGSSELQRLAFRVTRESLHAGALRLMGAVEPIRRTDLNGGSILAGLDALWDTAHADEPPDTWIHSDPTPANIRMDDSRKPTFIDFEDTWYGPAPIMGALAIDSITRRCPWVARGTTTASLVWDEYLRALDLPIGRHRFQCWLKLADFVQLVRHIDRCRDGQSLLLHEESPRRSAAVAAGLRRLSHAC